MFFSKQKSAATLIDYKAKNITATVAINTHFCVPAGTLSVNVITFSICAFISLALLTWRRYSKSCGEAELGGPAGTKWLAAVLMIVLWGIYIGVSSYVATVEKQHTPALEKMMEWYTNSGNYTQCALIVRATREKEKYEKDYGLKQDKLRITH